jgi:pimeloyl-ACP methyl ester carboxylesterase
VKLADRERRQLERCPRVTLLTLSGAGHFTLNEKPTEIANLILEALSNTPG